MKCQNCNHSIKRAYTWNGQTLGIECWKKIALPEIESIRAEKWAAIQKAEWQKSYAIVEAIKQKDFSKIKSEFKINFLKSLVTQFEERGFISPSQRIMVWGTGKWNGSFYDNGMFNGKDKLNEIVARFNIGLYPLESFSSFNDSNIYSDKEMEYIKERIGL